MREVWRMHKGAMRSRWLMVGRALHTICALIGVKKDEQEFIPEDYRLEPGAAPTDKAPPAPIGALKMFLRRPRGGRGGGREEVPG